MHPIQVMVNGLPGNVAKIVAGHMAADDRFELIPCSLTGPEIDRDTVAVGDTSIHLIRPDTRDADIIGIKESHGGFISVDYTHPSAVNVNAEFYCRHGLPFVMGTTGGDRDALLETVRNAGMAAVIAPNMAKQIVGFQAMMEWAAETFPGLFQGYTLEIKESHQQGKADTSGTAKAMAGYFNKLGASFSVEDIIKERDPERQHTVWGIPKEHLAGHGWHTYTLASKDQTVKFQFTHNVNGRDIYVNGTVDAVLFLDAALDRGATGRVFSMIDVLKAGGQSES
jgi:4-hydroxy-tetrahydrodipicolinate reductase